MPTENDVDLVAVFLDEGMGEAHSVTVYLDDPRWNFEERVNRLLTLHPDTNPTRGHAERLVMRVIAEKEHDPGVSVTFATRSRKPKSGASLLSEPDDF